MNNKAGEDSKTFNSLDHPRNWEKGGPHLCESSLTSRISWDKTVTATPGEIRDWGQIKLSSESNSQHNSRDKMTNLRLKAYRRSKIRLFSAYWKRFLRTTFGPIFIWHRSHELCPSAWEVPGQVRGVNLESGDWHILSWDYQHTQNTARMKLGKNYIDVRIYIKIFMFRGS